MRVSLLLQQKAGSDSQQPPGFSPSTKDMESKRVAGIIPRVARLLLLLGLFGTTAEGEADVLFSFLLLFSSRMRLRIQALSGGY